MIDDLKAEYQSLYGKKPHHKLSEQSLIEAIDAKKDEKGEAKEQPKSESKEVDETAKVPEKVEFDQKEIDRQFEEVQNEIAKVKDGKRHLVYKDGKGIWWRESVIEVYLARNGAESLTFPENTQYITDKEIKRCTSCG